MPAIRKKEVPLSIIRMTVFIILFVFIALNSFHVSTAQTDAGTGDFAGSSLAETAAISESADPERISLDLKGIDIAEIFRILSQKMGVTIVPSKNVTGRVNVYLNNLTVDNALDVLLSSQNLACERSLDVINVMTAAEYEKLYGKKYHDKRKTVQFKIKYAKPAIVFNALSQLKSNIGKLIVDEASGTVIVIDIPEKLEFMCGIVDEIDRPLQTKVFHLNHATPKDIKSHLAGVVTDGISEVIVDERVNKVAVTDLPTKMQKISRIIEEMDSAEREVFIEAEIVRIILRREYQRGFSWEKMFTSDLDGLDMVGKFPVSSSFEPSPGLGTTNFEMSIGTLAKDRYSATIQLLETFGEIKIVSRPRIAAINGEEAKVMVGTREAFITQTLSQAESTTVTSDSVEFIDVGVKLNVTPRISENDMIRLKIRPEISSVSDTVVTGSGSRIPIVETTEAETTVKVANGSMIMIAGLIKDQDRDDQTGAPGLQNIPLFGNLFNSKSRLNQKEELVIFITPHIISGRTTFLGNDEMKSTRKALIEPKKKDLSKKLIDEVSTPKVPKLSDPVKSVKKKAVKKKSDPIQDAIKGIKAY